MNKLKILFFGILILFGTLSCSIFQNQYVDNEVSYEPHYIGEIKENNLKGKNKNLRVELSGTVTDFESPVKNFELVFTNKETNLTYQTNTDLNGEFKLDFPSGNYFLYVKNSNPWFGMLVFDNLIFKNGEIREFIICTESLKETVVSEIVYKNKRKYKKYLREKEKK